MKGKEALWILLSIAISALGVLVALAVLFARWRLTGLMPTALLPLAYVGVGVSVLLAGVVVGAWMWLRRR